MLHHSALDLICRLGLLPWLQNILSQPQTKSLRHDDKNIVNRVKKIDDVLLVVRNLWKSIAGFHKEKYFGFFKFGLKQFVSVCFGLINHLSVIAQGSASADKVEKLLSILHEATFPTDAQIKKKTSNKLLISDQQSVQVRKTRQMICSQTGRLHLLQLMTRWLPVCNK